MQLCQARMLRNCFETPVKYDSKALAADALAYLLFIIAVFNMDVYAESLFFIDAHSEYTIS